MAIHDGETAGSSSENSSDGTAVSTTDNGNSTNTAIRETELRAKQLGLSDDLIGSYKAAFGSKEAKENTDNSNTENGENEAADLDSEFEEAIKGKFKEQYQSKMKTAVLDRVSSRDKQIAQQQEQIEKTNSIIELLALRYPKVKPDDYDGLLKAIREDDSTFTQVALDKGITAKEALKAFDEQKANQAQQQELETLRAEKAKNDLDARFRNLAVQTKAEYPDFNLEEEFANPNFRSALDYIAAQNTAANKASGKNDEIFNLTKAYEMAHWEKIRDGVVQRSAKAAVGAVSQSIATGAKRPNENANSKSAPAQAKSFADMDIHSKEFEQFMADVKAGKRHI